MSNNVTRLEALAYDIQRQVGNKNFLDRTQIDSFPRLLQKRTGWVMEKQQTTEEGRASEMKLTTSYQDEKSTLDLTLFVSANPNVTRECPPMISESISSFAGNEASASQLREEEEMLLRTLLIQLSLMNIPIDLKGESNV